MGNKINVKKAIEVYKSHWIRENDLLPLQEMEESARGEIERILRVSDAELKGQLANYISMMPYIDLAGINWVMDHNTVEEIRSAFSILLNDKKSEADRIDAMLTLEGVGTKYASQFLDIATKGGYMIDQPSTIDAIKELEPKLLPEDFIEVIDRRDLEKLVKAFRELLKKYKFESHADLLVFLRNGYSCDWKFEDI
jgi:hypothetical protein